MIDRELMQMALLEIERLCDTGKITGETLKLAIALRERLAQPEPKANWERVTKKDEHGNEISWFNLKNEWVGLTEQDLKMFNDDARWWAKYWEAKLKEKNNA